VSRRIPKLCRHRQSGQGYVTDPALGREVYFGRHGTPECQAAYDQWVRSFLARPDPRAAPGVGLRVAVLLEAHLRYADGYYRKRGKPTNEVANFKRVGAAVLLCGLGLVPAEDFGPRHLKQVRERLVKDGLARPTVNGHCRRLVRLFAWAAAEELVPAGVVVALRMVPGLKAGRTEAREPEPVTPADPKAVEAVLPLLSPKWRDAALFQRAAGLRPAEALAVRPCDLDRTSEPWRYDVPGDWNKAHHRGRVRVAFLGPQARAVLLPRLGRARKPEEYLFRGRFGTAPASGQSYRRAVRDACDTAGVPRWSPNMLRHGKATEVRAAFGAEAARVALGHANLATAEIYAEKDMERVKMVMERLG
jgi:integrase